MNRKSILIIAALVLMIGAAFLLQAKREAKSDVVIITTQDKKSDEKSELPDAGNKTPVTVPSQTTEVIPPTENNELHLELAAAMEELPTNSEMKELSTEETHHTPEAIQKAGKLMGELLSKAQASPERRQETLRFSLSCAENEELVDSVRALCWNTVMTKVNSWKIFVPIANAKVPPHIKSLASKLH